jgi:ubiquinone/menaquinone biosynthesis C-methylase UbiE
MFTNPEKNLEALELKHNEIVVDLGAGTGFYSIAAARLVPQGKVYAIEVQRNLLAKINSHARDAQVHNIESLWGNIEKVGGTKLRDNVADAVIISNVFFQIEDKETFIKEVKRILKSHGRILFVDWSDNSHLAGSMETFIPESQARALFEKNNFDFKRDIDAGLHHYGMIIEKK